MKNPFVGPRAYAIGEHLYGRDAEGSRLFHLVLADRVVLLHSPSGAGKTSLLQAVLTPRLVNEEIHVLGDLRMNREPAEKPSVEVNRYLLSTMLSIERDVDEKERLTLQELATTPFPLYLSRIQERRGGAGTPIALIFDQFEMIFSLDPTDVPAKEEFFTVVGQILKDRCFYAIFAMREEFIAELDVYAPRLPTEIRSRQRLSLLTKAQAVEAIRKPAEEQRVDFAAAEKLVSDLSRVTVMTAAGARRDASGPFVEPVQLQVVCLTIWERPRKNRKVISEAELRPLTPDARVDSVDAALQEYYQNCVNAVVAEGHAAERQVRDWISRNLISPKGIRQQVLLDEEDFTLGLSNKAIELLEGEGKHLLRRDVRGGRLWTELAHDRLINPIRRSNAEWNSRHLELLQRRAAERPWVYLRGRELIEQMAWAKENQESLAPDEQDFLDRSLETLSPIERAAVEWELSGFPESMLLRGSELRAAKALVREKGLYFLTQSARALLAESRYAMRWRWISISLVVGGVLAAIGVIVNAVYLEPLEKERTVAAATRVAAGRIDESKALDVAAVREAIAADAQIVQLAAATPALPVKEKVVIAYFAKESDTPKLKRALDELGFDVQVRESVVDPPTNCIWYGPNVSEQNVKLVVYALIRAGIELQGLYPRSDRGANVVQIGYFQNVADAPPLTVEEVEKRPLSALARPVAARLGNGEGTIQSIDPASGTGKIQSGRREISFRLPDKGPVLKPGDDVQFVAFRSPRGIYAVQVKRAPRLPPDENATAPDTVQPPPQQSKPPLNPEG